MTAPTLRELCEAVRSTQPAREANLSDCDYPHTDEDDDALERAVAAASALHEHIGSTYAINTDDAARAILAALDAERAAAFRDAAEWCEAWGPISSTKGDFNKGCAATYEHAASHFRYAARYAIGTGDTKPDSAPTVDNLLTQRGDLPK